MTIKSESFDKAIKALNGLSSSVAQLKDWQNRINLDTFNLADPHPHRCILGQLFGSYSDGTSIVFPRVGNDIGPFVDEIYTDLWKNYIIGYRTSNKNLDFFGALVALRSGQQVRVTNISNGAWLCLRDNKICRVGLNTSITTSLDIMMGYKYEVKQYKTFSDVKEGESFVVDGKTYYKIGFDSYGLLNNKMVKVEDQFSCDCEVQ